MKKSKRIPSGKVSINNTAAPIVIGRPFRKGPDPRRSNPFRKGPDPRRHTHGQINKKALAFNRSLRDLLIAEGLCKHTDAKTQVTLKKAEWMTKVVWGAALTGESWAVQLIWERIEGKVKDKVEITQPRNYFVIYADGNGGGV